MKHTLLALATLTVALPLPAGAASPAPQPSAGSIRVSPSEAPSPQASIEPIQPRARRLPPSAPPAPATTPAPSPKPVATPVPAAIPTPPGAAPAASSDARPSALPSQAPSEAPAPPPSPKPTATPAQTPARPTLTGKRPGLTPSLVLPPAPARRPLSLLDDLVVDFEGGALAFLQNDQWYGLGGTRYTRSTVALDRNLFAAQRTSFEARAFDRHTLIFLYAPVDVTTRVTLDEPLTFRYQTFPKGAVIDHRYLFDGIRATYLYRFYEGHGLKLEGGATLGVRNAEVSIRQANGERFAAERDIGPVPALRGRARYDTAQGFYALLDVDAGGTPPGSKVLGGIFDSALTLGVPLQAGLDATLRLRYLAGGADVPNREIVNWAQFASASAGFRFSPRLFWGSEERR